MIQNLREKVNFLYKLHPDELIDVLKIKYCEINGGKKVTGLKTDQDKVGNVLMSYIVDPFIVSENSRLNYRHQNKWESWAIVRIFNELGYNVDLFQHNTTHTEPNNYNKYDVLFGMGSNYEKFSTNLPEETTRVFYGTGKHWKTHNCSELRRLKRLNSRRNISLDPHRQILQIDHKNLTDYFIIIGDKVTIKSYTQEITKPAFSVLNSIPPVKSPVSEVRTDEKTVKNFMWFGGSGFVHKGLDLVLESFSSLKDLNLYVCGPIGHEEEFENEFSEELYGTENIHTIGKVNIESSRFRELCEKCSFMIYPSSSESGYPGSVVVSMRFGVIPIIPDDVGYDTGDWAVRLENSDVNEIMETCRKCSQMSPTEVGSISSSAIARAKEAHSRDHFSTTFKRNIEQILEETE